MLVKSSLRKEFAVEVIKDQCFFMPMNLMQGDGVKAEGDEEV
jgi:hypothetical protein